MAEKKNYRIAIIVCWIGELPEYFPLWLKSCECNKNIDFLIYTDKKVDALPANVKIIDATIDSIRQRAEKSLGLSAEGLTYAYKLCDIKPFYGMIFADDLVGYTHWGHCDIDMFFGSFDKFITDEMLEKHDKIFRYGHLQIYKNTDEVNRRAIDLKGGVFSARTVLKHKEHYSFDEVTGIDRIYRKHKCPYYKTKLYIDVSVRNSKKLLLNDADKNFDLQAFAWEDGKVLRYYKDGDDIKSDEWLYIHFQKKAMPLGQTDLSENSFWITIDGVVPKAENEITSDCLRERNRPMTHDELKREEKLYKKKKTKAFFKKTFYEKLIYIKQRGMRILDGIFGI